MTYLLPLIAAGVFSAALLTYLPMVEPGMQKTWRSFSEVGKARHPFGDPFGLVGSTREMAGAVGIDAVLTVALITGVVSYVLLAATNSSRRIIAEARKEARKAIPTLETWIDGDEGEDDDFTMEEYLDGLKGHQLPGRYIRRLVLEMRTKCPVRGRNPADVECVRRMVNREMLAKGMRPTHINKWAPFVVAAVCVPSRHELAAAAILVDGNVKDRYDALDGMSRPTIAGVLLGAHTPDELWRHWRGGPTPPQ